MNFVVFGFMVSLITFVPVLICQHITLVIYISLLLPHEGFKFGNEASNVYAAAFYTNLYICC